MKYKSCWRCGELIKPEELQEVGGETYCDSCYQRVKAEKTYKITRFSSNGLSVVTQKGLTLKEAQEHCQRPDTSGVGWFDGYEEE